MKNAESKYINAILSISFMAIICYSIFYQLGHLPILLWDESRAAMNALEMLNTGNYFSPHFNGEVDFWNTKPPLLPILQVFWVKLLGWNEWAIRMPSVMANLGIITCLLYFSKKHLYNIKIGALAAIILFTTRLFVDTHISRTGDTDALLCFFTLSASLSYFLFIRSKLKKRKYLSAFIAFICLAVFTKGIAGLLILPGLFIYTLHKEMLKPLSQNKFNYLPILTGLTVIASYYIAREFVDPGYLKAVFKNELGGRYLKTYEQHHQPIWFYFGRIFSKDFFPWILILIPSFFFINKRLQLQKDLVRFLFINICFFLLIITISQTKLYWYLAPTLPWFSLLFAYTIFELTLNYFQFSNQSKWIKQGIVSIAILCFLIPSFGGILRRINNQMPKDKGDQYGFFINSYQDQYKDYFISKNGYHAGIDFYIEKAKRNGIKINPTIPTKAKIGERILVCTDQDWAQFDSTFIYTIIEKHKDCALLEIIKRL